MAFYLDAITPGSDSNSGTLPSAPWATLAHADSVLTTNEQDLFIMYPDGVYRSVAPVWHGMLSYYPMVVGFDATSIYDIYNGHHATLASSTVAWQQPNNLSFDGTTSAIAAVTNFANFGPTSGGAFIIAATPANTGAQGLLDLGSTSGAGFIEIFAPYSDGNVYFDYQSTSGGRVSFAFSPVVGQQQIWGFLVGGTYQAIYLGPVRKVFQSSNLTYAYTVGTKDLHIGQVANTAKTFNGTVQAVMIKASTLADSDYLAIQSWLTNTEFPRLPANQVTVSVVNPTPRPIMVWDPWRVYNTAMTDANARAQAAALVSTGLLAAGYNYLTITEGWCLTTRSGGNLQVDTSKFPSGIPSLVNYLHSLGIKVIAYLGPGSLQCGNFPGSQGFEMTDAALVASWGADFLFYDSCVDFFTNNQTQYQYRKMALALKATGRAMGFMVSCPVFIDDGVTFGSNSLAWVSQVGGSIVCSNLDQGTPLTWAKLENIMDAQVSRAPLVQRGRWNWPDYLGVGNGTLTDAEGRTDMGFYCMIAAPLWIGCDLTTASATTIGTYGNADAIRINQDWLGNAAQRYSHVMGSTDFMDIWARPLTSNQWAVALINRDSVSNSMSVAWSLFGQIGPYSVKDVFAKTDLGLMKSGYSTTVASHDISLLLLTPPPAIYQSWNSFGVKPSNSKNIQHLQTIQTTTVNAGTVVSAQAALNGIKSGDIICMRISWQSSSGSVSSVSGSLNGSYTIVPGSLQSYYGQTTAWYYLLSSASGNDTVTVTLSGSLPGVVVEATELSPWEIYTATTHGPNNPPIIALYNPGGPQWDNLNVIQDYIDKFNSQNIYLKLPHP